MLKIVEIERATGSKREVSLKNGVYTVKELGQYKLEYTCLNNLTSNLIFVEDEVIEAKHIGLTTANSIITKQHRFFEDYFGFAKIQINGEEFQVNILGEKFNIDDIKDIILFLYEKNHFTLNRFVSKSSTGASSIYNGKDYVYSSKYLKIISNAVEVFSKLFPFFKQDHHTVIRKEFLLANYSNYVGDSKSIEWLFQNLDNIDFDYSYRNHPDGIFLGHNFGVVNKIGVEANRASTNTYENAIILGVFRYMLYVLSDIEKIIQHKIEENHSEQNNSSFSYIDFRDLKIVPFIKLSYDIKDLKSKLRTLANQYANLFKDCRSLDKFPKLSPVFNKYKHYQKAYSLIREIRSSKYDLTGEIQLLNVRKLSQLYELFNLYCIISFYDKSLLNNNYKKEIFFSNDDQLRKISYTNEVEGIVISVFHTPTISTVATELDLILIGHLEITGNYCCPDFVIEFRNESEVRYCILDAKYSKIETVRGRHLKTCIEKYIIDCGVKGAPYQKADYLILLHPDGSDQQNDIIFNINHFPKINTLISKPRMQDKLENILFRFAFRESTPEN